MKYFIIFLLTILIIGGCNRTTSVKALIFERVQIDSQQFQIKFRYVYNGKEYVDSSIVPNSEIKIDSIDVKIKRTFPSTLIPE